MQENDLKLSVLAILLGLLCITIVVGCADSTTVSQSDIRNAFVWFEKLGFPDVKDCRYIRIATGQWSQHGNAPRQNTYLNAFLIDEKDNTFTALTLDLFIKTFEKTEPNTPKHQQVAYEELNLEKEVKVYLNLLQNLPEDDHQRRFGERLNERAEVFVLAWACSRNGLESLSQQLCNQVFTMKEFEEKGSLIDLLQRDLGHAMMWRAVLLYRDPSVSRKELLSKFENIVKKYPKSEQKPRAAKAVKILRKMVKEDQASRKIKPPEEMSTEEQIADLIYQLREQNGLQFSQPGRCGIFLDPRGEKSPAHQLVKFGYDAVPQLIRALEDKRFTWSVGYVRDYFFSHYVLRVGDCALEILELTAARRFYNHCGYNYMSSDDKDIRSTQNKVKAWWKELQKKGEKQLLIDATEKGDEASPWQAKRLTERYPDEALEAVIKGAIRAKENWPRVKLVEIAAQIKGDEPIAFLTEEMKNGPFPGSRVAAAWGLHRKGRPEAVATMIREWKQMDEYGDIRVVDFLIGCETLEAIRTIQNDLPKLNIDLRIYIIDAIDDEIRRIDQAMKEAHKTTQNEKLKINGPALLQALEGFLVSYLTDTEEYEGFTGTWHRKYFYDPPVCDMAGHVLWLHWKDKYAFDANATLKERDLQRIECINIWRKQHELPLLPLPHPRTIPPLPREKIGPLLEKILEVKKESDITNIVNDIEALGLPSLNPVWNLFTDLPDEHPAVKQLEALAKRLSCIVAEISLAEGSLEPNDTFTRLLDSLKGKALTSEKFIGILLHFATDIPKDSAGIRVKALRYEDLTGVDLIVKLPTHKFPARSDPPGWNCNNRVTVGNNDIYNSFGTGSFEPEDYNDLKKAIDKALSSPPNLPFIIRTTLIKHDSSTFKDKWHDSPGPTH
jgi:hypothetical protein